MPYFKTKQELFEEIIEYLYARHRELDKQQNLIRNKHEDHIKRSDYAYNYGKVSMLAEIHSLLEELKKKY